jgi:hypothetical protein
MDVQDIGMVPTKTGQWAKAPSLSAAAGSEGVAVTPTAFTMTDVTATAAPYELAVEVSKMAERSAMPGFEASLAMEMAYGLSDAFDSLSASMLPGFSNTVGSTGVNITYDDMISAITLLNTNAKARAVGGVFVLHPVQIGDLLSQAVSASAGLAPALSREQFNAILGDTAGSSAFGAMAGSLAGVPVIRSGNVPTANAGSDRAGALFVAGQSGALGAVIKWEPEIEQASLAVKYTGGKAVFGDAAFGVVEINDSMGVSIITDA